MTETHGPNPAVEASGTEGSRHPSEQTPRVRALDGMRGIAMVLVILSHGWIIWPTTGLHRLGSLANVFASGNLAVSLFFVIGGYLLTRGLLRQVADQGEVHVWRTLLRRVLRVATPVFALILVMLVVAQIPDPKYQDVEHGTAGTAAALGTFTWNWHLLNDPSGSRPDMGHMWFVSVYVQVLVVLVFLVAVLGRRTWALAGTLAAGVLLVSVWRHQSLETDGEIRALLRTTTRMDGMLWGALLACVQPKLRVSRASGNAALVGSVAGLITLVLLIPDAAAYLSVRGVLVSVCACLFIMGTWFGDDALASRLMGGRAMASVGRRSMLIFIWHYPVLWWVSRHGVSWPWPGRLAVAAMTTLLAVYITERFIDVPVQTWLDRSRWTRRPTVSAVEAG